jgi:hypothetical protein
MLLSGRVFYARRIVIAVSIVVFAFACGSSSGPAKSSNEPSPDAATPQASATPATIDAGSSAPLPETLEQAQSQVAAGVNWSNVQVREHYLRMVARIGASNDDWKKQGLKAEDRAKKAFQMRYEARLICRAMMTDKELLEALRARDQRKFGHPDGPTFDELVKHEEKKGLKGDAVFEAIVASAQRTDAIVNELIGASPPPK